MHEAINGYDPTNEHPEILEHIRRHKHHSKKDHADDFDSNDAHTGKKHKKHADEGGNADEAGDEIEKKFKAAAKA